MSPTTPPISVITKSKRPVLPSCLHIAFYLVGDVGYNLHRLAQVVAASFLVDDAAVDAAGGHIVGRGYPDVGETFIVAQVEVGLMPVDGYIAFAVFIGAERAGVDVDIGRI